MKIVKNLTKSNKTKLKDLCKVNLGQSPTSESYSQIKTDTPFFQGAADFTDKYTFIRNYTNAPKKQAYKNDLLMTVRAPAGRVNFANVNCAIGRGLCSFNFKDEALKNYMYFYLNNLYRKNGWSMDVQGAIFEAINKDQIEEKDITIDFETYGKISSFLSVIENRLITYKNLLEKIEIRNQYYADKLLSGELRLTRNGLELKNNEDYEYDKIKISDICQISTGKKDANEGSENGLYEFFTCSLENKKINSYSYDEEAILITGNGDPGVCKYFNGKFDAYQRVYILRNIQINPKYFYYILKNYFKDSIQNSKIGGVIQYIRLNDISDFEFKYPKNEDINTILVFLDKLKDEKEKVEKLLKLEEQRFEWLSDKLLSGEYIIED